MSEEQLTTRDLVPLPAGQQAGPPAVWDAPGAPPFWCSWPLDTPEARADVMRAKSGATVEFGDVAGEEITLRGVLIHPYEVQEEDGQVYQRIRQVLLLADGRAVSFGALSLLNDLRMLMFLYPPPWKIGPTLKIRASRNKHGGSCYNLEIVSPPNVENKGKGANRGK